MEPREEIAVQSTGGRDREIRIRVQILASVQFQENVEQNDLAFPTLSYNLGNNCRNHRII